MHSGIVIKRNLKEITLNIIVFLIFQIVENNGFLISILEGIRMDFKNE